MLGSPLAARAHARFCAALCCWVRRTVRSLGRVVLDDDVRTVLDVHVGLDLQRASLARVRLQSFQDVCDDPVRGGGEAVLYFRRTL